MTYWQKVLTSSEKFWYSLVNVPVGLWLTTWLCINGIIIFINSIFIAIVKIVSAEDRRRRWSSGHWHRINCVAIDGPIAFATNGDFIETFITVS